MKANKYDIVVIIPVKDEQDRVVRAVKSFENISARLYFIIVDDNSADETVKNARQLLENSFLDGEVFQNDKTLGAGYCRNFGLSLISVETEYIMFFDADDVVLPKGLDALFKAANETHCDFALGKYHLVRNCSETGGMHPKDVWIWNGILKEKKMLKVDVREHRDLCRIVAYPWNKLIRYEFAKKISLKFSNTHVHNDIFANWQLFMNHPLVTLLDEFICSHHLIKGSSQLTNKSDKLRLEIFSVLRDVDVLVFSNLEFYKNFAVTYLKFKNDLVLWAYMRINIDLRLEFREQVKASYSKLTLSDIFYLGKQDARVVVTAVSLKVWGVA